MNALLDAATRQKYGSSERVLGDEMRRVGAHNQTIDAVYAQYQQQVAQLAAQQQQAMAQAAQAQAQTTQGVVGAQTALGVGQQQATQQTAARYGLDGGQQAAQATQLAGQLGAVQGAYGQAQAGTTAAIGLAQGERLRSSQQAGAGQRVKARERNADELKLLFGKQMDLEQDKGDFRTTLRHEIGKQEREHELAAAALGVKDADSRRRAELAKREQRAMERERRRQARDRKADNAREDRKLDLDIEHKARTRAQKDKELEIREREAAAKGVKSKLTPAQRNEWKQKKARIMELQKAFEAGIARGESTAEISKRLNKYSRVELNMARELAVRFRLGATNRLAAKSYFPGGHIPGGFITKKP